MTRDLFLLSSNYRLTLSHSTSLAQRKKNTYFEVTPESFLASFRLRLAQVSFPWRNFLVLLRDSMASHLNASRHGRQAKNFFPFKIRFSSSCKRSARFLFEFLIFIKTLCRGRLCFFYSSDFSPDSVRGTKSSWAYALFGSRPTKKSWNCRNQLGVRSLGVLELLKKEK